MPRRDNSALEPLMRAAELSQVFKPKYDRPHLSQEYKESPNGIRDPHELCRGLLPHMKYQAMGDLDNRPLAISRRAHNLRSNDGK